MDFFKVRRGPCLVICRLIYSWVKVISELILVMMDFLLLVLFLSAGLLCSQMYQILALQICRDRDVLLRKYCFSFGFCLNYLLPPSPQLGQLVQLFWNAKNVDLSYILNDSLSKILHRERQNTCFVGHVYNLKNSSKFKLLAFWKKKTLIIDQKWSS